MTSRTGPKRLPSGRILLVAGLLVAAGIGEHALRRLVADHVLPTGGARWIWAPADADDTATAAFWAVTELELEAVPRRASLHVVADAEYIAFLNRQRIGSGAWYPGAELDSYDVSRALVAGRNRLAVQLRSARGAGGMLALLTDDDSGRVLARSNGDWRIFDRAKGVVTGASDLSLAEPAWEWGSPPAGAWGAPERSELRPAFYQVVDAGSVRYASPLQPLEAPRRHPRGGPNRATVFDFGEEVTGYLVFTGPREGTRYILFDTGTDRESYEDRGEALLSLEQPNWSAVESRTFRYVRVWGDLPRQLSIAALPVSARQGDIDAERRRQRERGVFGLPVPGR
jgi:hypothetical protein